MSIEFDPEIFYIVCTQNSAVLSHSSDPAGGKLEKFHEILGPKSLFLALVYFHCLSIHLVSVQASSRISGVHMDSGTSSDDSEGLRDERH